MQVQSPVQRHEERAQETMGAENATISLELSDSQALPIGKLPKLSEPQFPHSEIETRG